MSLLNVSIFFNFCSHLMFFLKICRRKKFVFFLRLLVIYIYVCFFYLDIRKDQCEKKNPENKSAFNNNYNVC